MNRIPLLLLLLGLLHISFGLSGQNAALKGKITDESGTPLPFASIYIKGTSKGTTTNIEGRFELELKPGTYEVVFQYIGYQQLIQQVQVDENTDLTIVLKEEAVKLEEVVVRADAEDPAYAIIRKAIDKRKYYRDLVESYSCDVYIKGNIKILDAPEKIFGQEVGNLGGSLDSNRQGIIYLSESQSKLHYKKPNDYKEVMISSKVSGNDNGFGFNRAAEMDFNLYNSHSTLGRQIISPIASNALLYYRYRLVGTLYDEEGRLINKIELIPRRTEDPVYRGFIYIVEDLWNIQSIDVYLLSGSMKLPAFDTLFVKQIHVPVVKPETWRLFSQTIRFRAGIFGFRAGGDFTAVYSEYDLNKSFERGFFGNEIFKVNEGANEKTVEFWDSLRPIPLTQEESVDYVRKDSLQEIRRSKTYLDSIDEKSNKFKVWDLLFGYSYNNSYERRYFEMKSPLTTIQFNTVQGWNADLRFSYRSYFDEFNIRWFRIEPEVSYGFSDNRLRAKANFTYNFNRINNARLYLQGGVEAVQFNQSEPISPTLNTVYSLLSRDNFAKFYDKSFGKVIFGIEVVNGIRLTSGVEYSRRSPLVNNSDYSFFGDDDDTFQTNNPLFPELEGPSFVEHEGLILDLTLRLRYKQKYISYPNRRFNQGSSWPTLFVNYRKGIAALGSDINFDQISIRLVENYLALGLIGYMQFRVEAGTFLNQERIEFVDAKHFNGNQTIIGDPGSYLNSFMLLPYYEYSTGGDYVQAHYQHHFESFLLDKIPGIRKLGWSTVVGSSFLMSNDILTNDRRSWWELSAGFDQIGFGAFRLFRFDVVAAKPSDGDWQWGYLIGLRVPVD